MTPEELLLSMSYADAKEREQAKKYIALKGIVQYQRIIEFFKIQEQDSLPTYAKVSSLYKYDKRLRNTLYIYVATVEEYLRAIIGNKFEADEMG